jgi:hypothetical protein
MLSRPPAALIDRYSALIISARLAALPSFNSQEKNCTRVGTPDPKINYLDVIEQSVLGALKRELREPAALAEYMRACREEWQRLTATAGEQRKRIERRLGEIDRELAGITDLLIKGIGAAERLDARAKELQQEERRLKTEALIAPRSASPSHCIQPC